MPEAAGAVLEAPVSTGTGGEVSSQDGSTQEVSPQATGPEVDAKHPETSGGKPAEQQVPGTKADLRATLRDASKREALKAIDPALPGLLRDALHGHEQLMREFPGGLNEAIDFRKIVHEMGGREGLEEARQTVDDFSSLDEAYTEGKPEFVDRIAQGDPEAFERMVPLAIQKFGQTSPELYNHVMSRVIINTCDQAGLSNALSELYKGASEEAKPVIKQIFDWVEDFRTVAAKVPEKKVDEREQQLTQKEQQFAQQQAQALVHSVDSDSIKYRDSIIAREIKPFGDWQTMDPDRRGAVCSWISQRAGKTLNADNRFLDRRMRLVMDGDRNGLAKLEQSKLDELVPKLVPQAAKVFGVTKAAAKPGQPAAKPGQQQQATKPAPKGVLLVKEAPKVIDRSKTTPEMIFKNQAYRPDGQLVQWPA